MRYFLHLAYQGKNYSGWQRQTNAVGIQQIIEESITRILKEKIYIHGCGRTDAGVHAMQYFAHVDIKKTIDFDFIGRLNQTLPYDISCYELIAVDGDCHAQYDVRYRTYTYFFHTRKIPAKSEVSAYYNVPVLDIDTINEALEILKSTIDFRSLCKNPDIYKHTRCTIIDVFLTPYSDFEFKLTIKADRFLRGMIRYIMARLIEIGTGRLTLDTFRATLSTKAEFDFKHHKKGHPQGLYLTKIEYPYLQRDIVYPFDFTLR